MKITSESTVRHRNNNFTLEHFLRGARSYRYLYKWIGFVVAVAAIIVYWLSLLSEQDDFLLTTTATVEFGTPMCDATTGKCAEDARVASPRTPYTAWSSSQNDRWQKFHATLQERAQAYAEERVKYAADAVSSTTTTTTTTSVPLILLGDSITEDWLGTSYGEPSDRAAGIPVVLEEMIQNARTPLDPLVLAISGDQTQHLLYRLQNKELPSVVAQDKTAIFVVLIGTNNLGSGHLPAPTAEGIIAVADYLLSNTQGYVGVFDVLPRGDVKTTLARLCPPRCTSKGQPFSSFQPAVDKVNAALHKELPRLQETYGNHRISSISCGDEFLKSGSVDSSLMPDLLHPNVDGQRILAKCIINFVNGIL